jgi:hypothetical protein
MNRQTSRNKSRPKTGNVSMISNNGTSSSKKIMQKRTLSTTRNKSTNNSKEKLERNSKKKFGNEMISPKTIEYSKSKN